MKKGDVVELMEDTSFYKKGKRAVIYEVCDGKSKFEIIYEGEKDIDVVPKYLFKLVKHR